MSSKPSGSSDDDGVVGVIIGLGLLALTGFVIYKVAKKLTQGGAKPSPPQINSGIASPATGWGSGGGYSGGGGGSSSSSGGGSSYGGGGGSSSSGGGGGYSGDESSYEDDSDRESTDERNDDESDREGKSDLFGDTDFRLFKDGCTDCLTPATNISVGDGKCKECAGTGHEAWTGQDCQTCGGSGDCQTCGGTGQC